MNIRLKTTNEVEVLLSVLQSSLQVSSKAAVMRIAVAFSLNESGDPRKYRDGICYDIKNQDGLDYLRHVILGNDDYIYKILFQQHLKCEIEDSKYFPELFNSHLERGIQLLNSEIKYCTNREKFLKKILKGCEI